MAKDEEQLDEISGKLDKIIVAIGGCGIRIARALLGKTDAEFLFIGRKEELEGLGEFATVDLGEKTRDTLSKREFSLGWEALRKKLTKEKRVFILAGLGGATGSGLVGSAASIARDANDNPKLFLIYPFRFEDDLRVADEVLVKLARYELHLYPNDAIAGIMSEAGPKEGYVKMEVVVKAVLRELEKR